MSGSQGFSLQKFERGYEEGEAALIDFRFSTECSTMLPASSITWVQCKPGQLVICFKCALVTITGPDAPKLREPLQSQRLKWVAARQGSGIEEILVEQKEETERNSSPEANSAPRA